MDLQGHRDHQDLPETQAQQAHQVPMLTSQDRLAHKDQLGQQEIKVLPVLQVIQEIRVPQGQLVLREVMQISQAQLALKDKLVTLGQHSPIRLKGKNWLCHNMTTEPGLYTMHPV